MDHSAIFPIANLNPQARHDYILQKFILDKESKANANHKRDIDVIRDHHKFLWDNDEDATPPESWEERLVKKYYDKLFKEYCISDLSRFKENKVALRWRVEKEVVMGKGQFICGNRVCSDKEGLRSWEVNFGYMENGEKKNALIKLRLCPECSTKLNYTSKKREIKKQKKMNKKISPTKESRKSKKHKSRRPSDDGDENNQIDTVSVDTQEDKESESRTNSDLSNYHTEDAGNIWEKPQVESDKIVREDEFEKYLEDLLL